MPTLLVFDLDDTLFPERDYALSGFQAVSNFLRDRHALTGFDDVARELFLAGDRGTIFDAALARLGFAHDAALIATLVAVYREHEPRIRLYGDAAWALRHFGERGAIGLLTDGYLAVQQRKVRALGIAAAFDAIVYSDAYGREHWKPSAVPYRTMMELTGFAGHDCVYVGDNPHKDFVSANALGWTTVRIRRDGGEHRDAIAPAGHAPRHEIASLRDLGPLLGGRLTNAAAGDFARPRRQAVD